LTDQTVFFSIGAFHWMDRASMLLSLKENSR